MREIAVLVHGLPASCPHLRRLGLTVNSVFDPCANLRPAALLVAGYQRARSRVSDDQTALRFTLYEYYSGNYVTGFRHGYVHKVIANAQAPLVLRLKGSVSAPRPAPSDPPPQEQSEAFKKRDEDDFMFAPPRDEREDEDVFMFRRTPSVLCR